MTDRVKALNLNKRILFWARLLVELKALFAVLQLFYLSRGLEVGQIYYLSVVWAVTVLITEIPSGYIADRLGRKNTIIAGVLINIVATALTFTAFSFANFVLISFLYSFSFALFTGTDVAILYDTLRELKQEKRTLGISGKYFSATRFGKIFIPFIGAIIAKGLLGWQFNILISIDLIGAIVSFFVALKLTEPDKAVDIQEKEEGIFRDAFNLIKENKTIQRFTFNKVIVFVASFIFWRIYQVILTEAGITIIFLGFIYVIFQSLVFVTYWFADKIEGKISLVNFFRIPNILGLIGVLGVLLFKDKWILYVFSILPIFSGNARDPIFLAQIQQRIKSFNRATTTSSLNVITNIVNLPFLLLAGFLANINLKYPLIISLVLFLTSLVFFPIKEKYIKTVR